MRKFASGFVLVILFLTSLPLFAEQVCSFQGDLDFLKHVFNLEMDFKEKSIFKTNINFDNDKFYLDTKIQNLKLNNHIFSTEISGQGEFIEKEGSKVLKCSLESRYSLMDYKPFNDIFSNFMVGRDLLVISGLNWGKSNIIGDISFVEPREVNLYAEIRDADINELAALIGLKDDNLVLSGTVDGFLRCKGPLSNLKISGQLKSGSGTIRDLSYQEISVKLEGTYPLINLYDCEIIEQDGTVYAFDGKINLDQLNNLYSGTHTINFSPLTKIDDLNWHKWTIRRNKERGNVEFENRVKSGRLDNLRLRDGLDSDMLGVEQTLKF